LADLYITKKLLS